MAAGSNSQQNFRKAIGAIKDTTMVGMAKVNSDFKALDVAILKATNHVESLPKEKHVRTIFGAVSGSRPRADVAYCIHTLARRLTKTRTWVVALKTLIVIHRALREVDHSFCEELISYNNSRGHMLNLQHFKDDSTPNAWDYSTWIRTYALYLEECLECFRVLKYDFYRDHTRTKKFDTPDLLERLPAMQQLLFRLLACQPGGSARYDFIIQYALSIVATESVRLYVAITDGVLSLVDKFFEMQRREAVRALDIYRKSVDQAERLSAFFEICRSLEIGQRQKYVKIEQPPPSFLTTMEEYVMNAPQTLMLQWRPNDDEINITPKAVVVSEGNLEADLKETSDSEDPQNPKSDKGDAVPLIPDLLSWHEPSQELSELNEKSSLALSLTSPEELSIPTISSEMSSEPAGWELALATTSSDSTSVAQGKVNLLDRSTLDRLYELALVRPDPTAANHLASNPFEAGYNNQETKPYPSSQMEQTNFMPMGGNGIPQQQAQYQQQGLSAGPDYMHLVGSPQIEQSTVSSHDYVQMDGIPQPLAPFITPPHPQEQFVINPDYMQAVEIPLQMEGIIAQGSTNPFGDMFIKGDPLLSPAPPQNQQIALTGPETQGQQGTLPCPPQTQSPNLSLI